MITRGSGRRVVAISGPSHQNKIFIIDTRGIAIARKDIEWFIARAPGLRAISGGGFCLRPDWTVRAAYGIPVVSEL